MTKKEKALKETDDKLKKKKGELWDFLLETKFSTRLSIQKENGLKQSIKELQERKKKLELETLKRKLKEETELLDAFMCLPQEITFNGRDIKIAQGRYIIEELEERKKQLEGGKA